MWRIIFSCLMIALSMLQIGSIIGQKNPLPKYKNWFLPAQLLVATSAIALFALSLSHYHQGAIEEFAEKAQRTVESSFPAYKDWDKEYRDTHQYITWLIDDNADFVNFAYYTVGNTGIVKATCFLYSSNESTASISGSYEANGEKFTEIDARICKGFEYPRR